MKPPSKKQLGYLKRLGYKGSPPASMREATLLIDAMLETKSSKEAEKELFAQRRDSKTKERERRKSDKQDARETIRWMVQQNKEYGGEGLFAGFLFEEIEGTEPSPSEEEYVGTFLPIQVAQRYPELLCMESIGYEEVDPEDRLPNGTRMVMSPGVFKTLRSKSGCMGALLLAVIPLVSLVFFRWLI